MDPVLDAFGAVMDQVTAIYERGETLGPEIEAELALMMDNISSLIASQSQEIVPPDEDEQEVLAAPGTIQQQQATNLLWIMAGGDAEAFVQYVHQYPDPSLDALKSNPGLLESIISTLENQLPPDSIKGPPADGIEKAQLNSSNIFGFKYDKRSRKLIVKFQGNKDYGQGPVYSYDGVPPVIASVFMKGAHAAKTSGKNKWSSWFVGKNPSLGSAMHHFIKLAGYPYQRLT